MANLLITGDFCPLNRIQSLVNRGEYADIFGDFLPFIKDADLAVTNLECPISSNGTKIIKTGPHLKTVEKTVEALSFAGFDLLTLANNHIMDYGPEGLDETIRHCRRAQIGIVGAGKNLEEASRTFYITINGIKLAILNFCENEWSVAKFDFPGSNSLNIVNNYYDIREAKSKTDYVFVIVHGGHENYSLPSPRMQETYRFFVDAGASAVIGHHTHCYSGYEVYQGSPIFYSLGNFVFDWIGKRNALWNFGYAVRFDFTLNGLAFIIIPYCQCNDFPGLRLLNSEEKKIFEQEVKSLNEIIINERMLEGHFVDFIRSNSNTYNVFLEPYSNRYLIGLLKRKLLPSMISSKKRRLLLNLFRCEAHRDAIIRLLEGQIK